MSYLALYRKYRPKTFEEVVGQESITSILQHQIDQRTFGHAYIFSGIRGTGKTSTAKIMAKAVNCLAPIEGNPCNQCEMCETFHKEGLIDVIEIDAASNNGVDNVRELREHSKFLPSRASYKVYIIDEVQMLSQGAFNALLKTLEEPSEHVLFILATTEPHKIPVTILSRCQRYDFKRVHQEALVYRMAHILTQEGIAFEENALALIAKKSEGAVRDALSMLEKAIANLSGSLTEESLGESLGIMPFDQLVSMMQAVYGGDLGLALGLVDELISSGIQIEAIFDDLLTFMRSLVLSKVHNLPEKLTTYHPEELATLRRTFEGVSLEELSAAVNVINKRFGSLKYAALPRLELEMVLIELAAKKAPQPVPKATPTPAAPAEKKEVLSKPVVEEKSDDHVQPAPVGNQDIISQWDLVLNELKARKEFRTYAFLVEGLPQRVKDNKIIIEFKEGYEFHMENIAKSETKAIIEGIVEELFNHRYNIEVMKYTDDEKVEEGPSEMDQLKDFLGQDVDKLTIE